MPGKLYLIPNLIHEDATAAMIPSYVGETIGCVRHFFVEERKAAIRFLKKLHHAIFSAAELPPGFL